MHAAAAYGAGVGIVFGGAYGEYIVRYGEVCAEHGCYLLLFLEKVEKKIKEDRRHTGRMKSKCWWY